GEVLVVSRPRWRGLWSWRRAGHRAVTTEARAWATTCLRLIPVLLSTRTVAIELPCGDCFPRECLEQGARFMLLNTPCTGGRPLGRGPWQQGLHRVLLADEGRLRLQHGDELRVVRPQNLLLEPQRALVEPGRVGVLFLGVIGGG